MSGQGLAPGSVYYIISGINNYTAFMKDMLSILSDLDKSSTYKLEFGLYYHSNDIEMSLKFKDNNIILSHDDISSSDKYNGDLTSYFLGNVWLSNAYEYKGVFNCTFLII